MVFASGMAGSAYQATVKPLGPRVGDSASLKAM